MPFVVYLFLGYEKAKNLLDWYESLVCDEAFCARLCVNRAARYIRIHSFGATANWEREHACGSEACSTDEFRREHRGL